MQTFAAEPPDVRISSQNNAFRQGGTVGQLTYNSALEAEAAEQAVNYHKVRRKVNEDIRCDFFLCSIFEHS